MAAAFAAAPQAQDVAAARLLVEADRLAESGDVDRASEEYALLVERFPESDEAAEALLALSRFAYLEGDGAEAAKWFDRLSQSFPNAPVTAQAWVHKGAFEARQATSIDELEEARASLRRVPILFGPGEFGVLPARTEARVRSGEIGIAVGDYKLAALDFLDAIEGSESGEWRARAYLGFAETRIEAGDWAGAADALQPAATIAGSGPLRDRALDRVTALHRFDLMAALSQRPWTKVRTLTVPGVPLTRPTRVAAGADGSIAVWDAASNVLVRLGRDGQVVERGTFEDVHNLSFADDGRLLIILPDQVRVLGTTESQRLQATVDGRSTSLGDLAGATTVALGRRIAIDADENLLASFDSGGRLIASRDLGRAELVDVVADGPRHVLVADRKEKTVVRYDLDLKPALTMSGDWRRIEAIERGPRGRVYVLEESSKQIQVLNPDGKAFSNIGPTLPDGTALRSPSDIAVDATGRVLIADPRSERIFVLE